MVFSAPGFIIFVDRGLHEDKLKSPTCIYIDQSPSFRSSAYPQWAGGLLVVKGIEPYIFSSDRASQAQRMLQLE